MTTTSDHNDGQTIHVNIACTCGWAHLAAYFCPVHGRRNVVEPDTLAPTTTSGTSSSTTVVVNLAPSADANQLADAVTRRLSQVQVL